MLCCFPRQTFLPKALSAFAHSFLLGAILLRCDWRIRLSLLMRLKSRFGAGAVFF